MRLAETITALLVLALMLKTAPIEAALPQAIVAKANEPTYHKAEVNITVSLIQKSVQPSLSQS